MQKNAETILRLIPNETLARLFSPFYDGTAGKIDLYAQGGRVVRDELTGIFTEIAFGEAQES
jgi:hypothetical protein